MGNGNHLLQAVDRVLQLLLTPHGEREHGEPVIRDAGCVVLLTPHGERELASIAGAMYGRGFS